MDFLALLHVIANWTSPLVQILGAPTAVVTFVITVRRVRKWGNSRFDDVFGVAQKAESHSKAAAAQAAQSSKQAKAADESSQAAASSGQDAARAVLWMAETVRKTLDQNEELLKELRGRPAVADAPPALIVPRAAGNETDPITVTGKHRFHSPETQRMQTLNEGDHP